MTSAVPWRVSLHGGHSGEFCDHATGTLREVLRAAVASGFRVFGVSEHAPRTRADLLYPEEVERGWTVEGLAKTFDAYLATIRALAEEFAPTLDVRVGFETEAAPRDSWVDEMKSIRARASFDYIVGSVHHVDDCLIDGPDAPFLQALEGRGGLEPLGVAYYERLGEMVETLRPEIVGHFDLIRKNGRRFGSVQTPRVQAAARRALDAVEATGGVLDLNVAALRKGMSEPYPAPWLVAEARRRGVGFCFGDDSHGPADVGVGLEAGRDYLLSLGVREIIVPHAKADRADWERVALD